MTLLLCTCMLRCLQLSKIWGVGRGERHLRYMRRVVDGFWRENRETIFITVIGMGCTKNTHQQWTKLKMQNQYIYHKNHCYLQYSLFFSKEYLFFPLSYNIFFIFFLKRRSNMCTWRLLKYWKTIVFDLL